MAVSSTAPRGTRSFRRSDARRLALLRGLPGRLLPGGLLRGLLLHRLGRRLGLGRPLQVHAVGPLVGLDVLEAALAVANRVELLALAAPMRRAARLSHGTSLGRTQGR